MSYEVQPLDIVAKEKVVDTRPGKGNKPAQHQWWTAKNDNDLVSMAMSTTQFLKRTNAYRIRQASIFSRLLCGKPLYNWVSSNSSLDSSNQLPIGRPTANVCYSCTDTLVSRITEDRPLPDFLTDGGSYKQQRLAKEANQFIQGEFYRTKAYEHGAMAVKDALGFGTGLLKVYAKHGKVHVERTLETELLVDFNDAYYGKPTQLVQMKLVDKSRMAELFPKKEGMIADAQKGNVDTTPRSTETIADQFIVSELWHLPSGPDADDGRHVIVCSEGVLLDEPWTEHDFPFVKLIYNRNTVGWFGQGLVEILMPTQMEIYRMLIVASQAIELMGVPRIYIDEMSKITETSFNNRVGTIIKGRGPTPPVFLNATSNAPEIYQWIEFQINNAYQIAGISSMSAAGRVQEGVESGEAIRELDAVQAGRFSAFQRSWQDFYVELAQKMLHCAAGIAEKGKGYKTLFVGPDGTKEVDFKDFQDIQKVDNQYVMQCYIQSALPKDPAGRQSRLSEMLAAGEITNQEFRRLSIFPDLKQSDQLAVALEERILASLDEIVENGEKNYADIAPDPFILDPSDLATTLVVQYINRYKNLGLEEEKLQVLRNWFDQVQDLKQQAMPPQPQPMPGQPGQQAAPPPVPQQASISPTSNVRV